MESTSPTLRLARRRTSAPSLDLLGDLLKGDNRNIAQS
jgi:hypothetical protein